MTTIRDASLIHIEIDAFSFTGLVVGARHVEKADALPLCKKIERFYQLATIAEKPRLPCQFLMRYSRAASVCDERAGQCKLSGADFEATTILFAFKLSGNGSIKFI